MSQGGGSPDTHLAAELGGAPASTARAPGWSRWRDEGRRHYGFLLQRGSEA